MELLSVLVVGALALACPIMVGAGVVWAFVQKRRTSAQDSALHGTRPDC